MIIMLTSNNKTEIAINTDHIVDMKRFNLNFFHYTNGDMDKNFIFKQFYRDDFYIAVINFDNGKRYVFWPDYIDSDKLNKIAINYIGRDINLYGAFSSAYNYLINASAEKNCWFNMSDFEEIREMIMN